MTFFYDLNKKLATIADQPQTRQLNERDMSRAKHNKYKKSDSKKVEEDFGTTAAIAGGAALGSALGAVKGRYDDLKFREKGATAYTPADQRDKPRTTMQRIRAAAGIPSKNDPNVKTNNEEMDEGSTGDYSAKKARAGKDIGKPGKQFSKIAKSAAERYGSRERGEKVAGAVLAKLRKGGVKEEYGPLEEKDVGEGNAFAKAVIDAKKDGIQPGEKITVGGKQYPVKEADMDESALQAYLGKKKYGKEGMAALQKAGREGASKEKMAQIRAQHDKMDEAKDDDDYYGTEKTSHRTAAGGTVTRQGGVTRHQAAAGRYGGYDPETDPDRDDDAAAKPSGEKRGRGRPKGTGRAIGAKGPSGKSKLLAREDDHDSNEVKQAMAVLKKAGYKISKGEEKLDEKPVSRNQAIAARIGRGIQKGEVTAKKGTASAEMAKMEPKELKKFAKTDTKGLPKKVKAKEEVEETTVSGSVATAPEAPKAKSKGGVQFGKGIYDSMNRELEAMIAESMNISMNMSNSPDGGPSKSLTVTATDEDAVYLGRLLKMAGVGGGEGGCGCGQQPCACNSAEQVDENQPDWPTDTETSNDALQYAGGLNKPKTTVAGDGQTTVPVAAVQVREGAEEELDEQEQVMAAEGMNEGMMKHFFVILDDNLIDQIANMDGAEVDPDAGTVETYNDNTAQQLAAFAQKNPNRLQRKQSMNTAGMAPMAQRAGGTTTGPDYALKEQEIDEELQRMREMAGIGEAAKPDYIDLDRDGDRKESMKKAADDAESDKKVEESILDMTRLWKAYKG